MDKNFKKNYFNLLYKVIKLLFDFTICDIFFILCSDLILYRVLDEREKNQIGLGLRPIQAFGLNFNEKSELVI